MANYHVVHVRLSNEKAAHAEWVQPGEGAASAEKGGSERRLLPSPGAGFALSSEEAVEALRSVKAAAGLTLPHQRHELLGLCSPVPPAAVSRSVLEPRWVSHGSDARRDGVHSLGVLLRRSSSGMNDIYFSSEQE